VSSRSYLSIGDVLTLLRHEFPDVTISKIRFLESQGLVNPERTPSGYRKFYEHDVERLRWVLRQQREHFLPLKVIKDRLDEDGSGTEPVPVSADGAAAVPETPTVHGPAPVAAVVEAPPPPDGAEDVTMLVGSGTTNGEATRESTSGRPGIETAARLRAPARATVVTPASAIAASSAAAPVVTVAPGERAHRASLATQSVPTSVRTSGATVANGMANRSIVSGPTDHAAPAEPSAPKSQEKAPRKAPTPPAVPATPAATPASTRTPEGAGSGNPPAAAGVGPSVARLGGASLSLEDLCSASGLTANDIAQLQEYALLSSTFAAGVEFFDEEALAVANIAAKFSTFGIEARHLRLYKNAADREAGFIEQIVIPMVRQRNPEARARATQTAEELSRLGQQMKSSLLRTALRNIL
jgi:DNA-binding transcriptional MerR regulator